jgi:uncharacterized protein YqgC (DUF456 family)
MSSEDTGIGIGVLLCIVILLIYIIVAEVIEKKKIDFIHESGVAIFLGVLAGFIMLKLSKTVNSPLSLSDK